MSSRSDPVVCPSARLCVTAIPGKKGHPGTWLLSLVAALCLALGIAAPAHAYFLWASNYNEAGGGLGHSLSAFNANALDSPTRIVSSGLTNPVGMAFDALGYLYVASSGNDAVRRFGPNGQDYGYFVPPTAHVYTPYDVAFDAAGNLYVATLGGIIQRFSPGGANLGTFATVPGVGFTSLAFDGAGNLYVTEWINGTFTGTIHLFSPAGADLGDVVTGLGVPHDLAIDAAGNLYVSIASADTIPAIRRFSSAGVDLGDFVSDQEAFGMVFDSSGNLYAAVRNTATTSQIRKYSPTGQVLGAFDTTSAGLFGVALTPAVGPVPEPGSLLLLATGLWGLAGLRARRRAGGPGVKR